MPPGQVVQLALAEAAEVAVQLALAEAVSSARPSLLPVPAQPRAVRTALRPVLGSFLTLFFNRTQILFR